MGMVAIFVISWSFEQTFIPHPIEAPYEIWLTCPVVSEEKSFKKCGRRRRTTEAYLSCKLTKWAELKKNVFVLFFSPPMCIPVKIIKKKK